MRKLLLLLGFISLIFSEKINAQTLIAGWDFQTAPGTAVVAPPNTPVLFNSNVGSGVLYLNGTNGASSWLQATELSGFTGTNMNGGGATGLSTTTTSPACLAILGGAATPTANGKSMVFKVNMSAYQNLIISYATQKTATGFSSQVWEYSTNGTTWVAIATVSTIPTSFAVQTLTSVTGLNGISNAFVRLTVTGATNATGNNRLDNIQFNATLIPVPTLTATPTTIPAFNYVLGNGPSTSSSYNLSGSVLSPSADTIKIFAPTNFEISKTAGSGFKDTLNIRYSGGAFASTPIYARLKAGLAENTYSDTIRHSGGGVNLTSGPKVKLSGSVTTVPPPVITTTGTLTAFSTFVGGNSTPQSYTVSGVNLTSDIVINAPAGYEIKTGMGIYATSITLMQVSGNVASTTIDVRLKGTATGTFAGNIVHTSTGVTPNVNVAVTGTVGAACGAATNIGTVRTPIPEQKDYSGPIVTIAGRVTARFGMPKFYLQDATGGIAIYSTLSGGVAQANNIALGDSIILTGQAYRAFGEAEIFNPTCVNKISTGTIPAPIIFDSNNPPSGINLPTFLDNSEGRLVKVLSANLSNSGSFASASNYPVTACNLQGDIELRIDGSASTIISQQIPVVSQDITGVIGHYIPNATVSILQLFPRTIADFTSSPSSSACITPVASPSASCGPLGSKSIPADSTLDVTCWNVEWLGNTTLTPSPLGPTNDAQQMINVMSVLKNVKSDIFCIEEVCDHRKFIDSVKVNLPKYKTRCQTKYYSHFFDSPENPTDAKTFSQKVCFVYDSTVVTMVDTISVLSDVYTFPANNWASGRLPFLFIGDVKVGGITKQIHFVGLHAKSGSAVADYNRRKQDVIDLKTKLDTSYPNANIIMLGDYNDDLDTSIAAGKTSSYANFVNDNVRYKQISRALSLCGVSSTAKYPDIIDHFMMSNEFGILPASGATPSPSLSGIYYLEKTINVTRPISYVTNYTTTTSDHYPVNARFTFKLPTEITSINSGNWSSPSTWSCNCVPSSSSNVTIDVSHAVTVDATSQVRSLNVKGTLNWIASFTLSLGQ